LKKPKNKSLGSDAARALVRVKLEKMKPAEVQAHAKMMSKAYWQSPAALARRRAIIEKKIAELQAKLAEIQKLEKRARST
jgi:hypothetical protein